jgi:hypothetical protein
MTVDPSTMLRTIRAEYREAWASSDAIIESVGDPDAEVTYHGKPRTLRWVMLGIIDETARHAGHADVIREQIDGRTGR